MSIVSRLKSFLSSPVHFGGVFCFFFVIGVGYIGAILNDYYHKQELQRTDLQLAQYEHQLKTKLNQLGHLLYAIDAFLKSDSTHGLFDQVAQSQLSNSELPVSLEVYHILSEGEISQVEQVHQALGSFDFRIQRPALSDHSDTFLTIVKAAPQAEFGHTLGQSVLFDVNNINSLYEQQKVMAFDWQQDNKWSLLLPRVDEHGLQTALGLSFELPVLLESLFTLIYPNTQHHIRVLLANQELFNSDWQQNYDLDTVTASALREVNFYGTQLQLQLFAPQQLHPKLLSSRVAIIMTFAVVASLCGILVWLQLRSLVSRNQTIHSLVVERTSSLNKANQQIIKESDKRLQALQQQVTAERKYKSVFMNSREGLFVLDKQGRLLEANPAFQQLFDISAESTAYSLQDFMLDDEFKQRWQLLVNLHKQHEELEWLASTNQHKSLWIKQTGRWLHHPDATVYEGRVWDVTQDKLFNEQLKYKAQHDSLTDLLNRKTFLGLVEHTHKHPSTPFILLYIDLDRFKLINDTLGHQAGDKLLVEFASRMQILLGGFSDIARLGGDEFAILIEQSMLPMALEGVLEDILAEIRKPFQYQQHSYTVSGSIGVRQFTAACGLDAEKLLHDADIAMYEAKRRGKNSYHIYTHALADQASQKLKIERALQDIDLDEELQLVLQPIYCQHGQTLKGFEALLRWHSPILGFVSPAEFIPIAEECGKIAKLGQWVFARAFKFMQQYADSNIFMSVNVSPLQLQSQVFMAWLQQQFNQSHLKPSQFKIELTESAMMTTEDSLIEPLELLHELGFGIYIDDFGTGYSSLARLNHLPVDGLKIDRAFIDGIESDEKPRQLIEAICAIAKSFNLTVTAEGIEKPEQLAVLAQLHCQQTQGYWMSKPIAEGNAVQLLANSRESSELDAAS